NSIDVMSLSYNRLMNHIRCMVARIVSGEKLKMNINDYMSVKFPEAFQAAQTICDEISQRLKLPVEEVEIGYLAMHMERMMDREEEEE
ncbi:MAG: PRD domain-containing protein, partial [Lachnospiraceae bacterium]|nr:PRD domain-containing protein [Lachnospiraceae bacterium]